VFSRKLRYYLVDGGGGEKLLKRKVKCFDYIT
jgi:hypothetical protein